MYTDRNFKSKKEFKEALKNGDQITIYSSGPFPCKQNGIEFIEGPHYPQPHKWYAQVTVANGIVTKIK